MTMIMYDNEYQTKENKILTKDKIEPCRGVQYASLGNSCRPAK